MKKEIALEWVAALRSGEYNQATEYLRSATGFCCLGVLCNLHAQAHPDIAKEQKSPYAYMSHSVALPHKVLKWAGMHNDSGAVRDSTLVLSEDSLAEANDSGYDFITIANWIEKNYHLL